MLKTKFHIILASNSPRRQQLIESMGLDFEIRIKPVDENFDTSLTPEEVALYLCSKKACAFNLEDIGKDNLIIAADTIVCLDNRILSKPKSREHTIEILGELSGKTHLVITGVALRTKEKMITFTETTEVVFEKLTLKEIEYYTDRFKPFDKAGAYGIQEWIGLIGVTSIKGSFYNVMGLPVRQLYEEILAF